jgi:copper chaperone NosL
MIGRRAVLTGLLALVAACGPAAPRALVLGEDQCRYCRMEITDARFGAQVILSTGRIEVFDSVECLAGFVRTAPAGSITSVWVMDATSPGRFVAADAAGYVVDGSLRGPMGRIVSLGTPALAAQQASSGGATLSWAAIVADSAGLLAADGH